MPKPRYPEPDPGIYDAQFAGRVGKYDAWIVKGGILVQWMNPEVENKITGTVHSWEAWRRGHLSHWPPGLTARINAIKGMLGYG